MISLAGAAAFAPLLLLIVSRLWKTSEEKAKDRTEDVKGKWDKFYRDEMGKRKKVN